MVLWHGQILGFYDCFPAQNRTPCGHLAAENPSNYWGYGCFRVGSSPTTGTFNSQRQLMLLRAFFMPFLELLQHLYGFMAFLAGFEMCHF